MVAVIKTGSSIHRIINYNENKVKEGMAECIGAGNYPIDVDKMSFNMKLNRLLKQAELNENVTRNSVHISLNFDASESFSNEKLMAIADAYMEKIGFGQQPYLVYQHNDAGHPHIHLVSIKVREDGSRIDTQNIGRNQSEKARKEIELSFGLVAADERKRRQEFELNPIPVQRVQYGRSETKKAIQNVLDHVIGRYRYTSLPELNAVLNQYNVSAERGSENSKLFINKGLVYRVLDEQGKKVGVPIKASAFYNKPTLKFLEEKYSQNRAKRMPHKARIKNAVDLALLSKKNISIQGLVGELEKQGIATTLRENAEGLIYGITYVDHHTKCVFNGSALGKQFSAKAIQERCNQNGAEEQRIRVGKIEKLPRSQHVLKRDSTIDPGRAKDLGENEAGTIRVPDLGKALDGLIQPEQTSDYVPYHLKKNRKRRKRKQLSNNQ